MKDFDQTPICGNPRCKSDELYNRSLRAYNYALYTHAREDFMVYAASELYLLTNDSIYKTYLESRNINAGNFIGRSVGSTEYEGAPGTSPYYAIDYFSGYLQSNTTLQSNPPSALQLLILSQEVMQTNDDLINTELLNAHRSPITSSGWGTSTTPTLAIPASFNYYFTGNLTNGSKQQIFDMWSESADFMLGANPFGVSWVVGLGTKYPQDALHVDSLVFKKMDIGKQMPGTVVYGPGKSPFSGLDYYRAVKKSMYPNPDNYPDKLKYADAHTQVTMAEFAVLETDAPALELFAALINAGMMPPANWDPYQPDHKNTLPDFPVKNPETLIDTRNNDLNSILSYTDDLPLSLDQNTIALYDLDTNYEDSSSNNLDLTAYGNASIVNIPSWSGVSKSFVKFNGKDDYLKVSIPDSIILPTSGFNITIEGKFYPKFFAAGVGVEQNTFIGLNQPSGSNFKLLIPQWEYRSPLLYLDNNKIGHAKEWTTKVDTSRWHNFKMIAKGNESYLFIDNQLIFANAISLSSEWQDTASWNLELGHFDGYIDEVKISKGSEFIDNYPPVFVELLGTQIRPDESLNTNISVFDATGISSLWINDTNNFQISRQETDGRKERWLLSNKVALQNETYYPINVSVNDTSGNINSEMIVIYSTLPLVDASPPYFVSAPNALISYLSPLHHQISATDDRGIARFEVNNTQFKIDSSGLLEYNGIFPQKGNYTLRITVYDTSEKSASTELTVSIVEDLIAPVFTNIINQYIRPSIPLSYDINATDDVAIGSFSINDTINFKINASSGLLENNTILSLGQYWLNVSVNDTSGNRASSILLIEVTSSTMLFSCFNINQSGNYLLMNSLVNVLTCMNITASNVTLDCQGYTLDGDLTGASGDRAIYAIGNSTNYLKNITVKNCNVKELQFGVQFSYVNDSVISNTNAYSVWSNSGSGGFDFANTNNLILQNISSYNQGLGYGISLPSTSKYNNITNSIIYNTAIGIKIGSTVSNIIKNSYIYNNSLGVNNTYASSSNNLFYNNLINNTNNLNFNPGASALFNSTQTSGTNIIGGNLIGGNFWANPSGNGYSETCADANNTGICDVPLNVTSSTACPGCSGYNIDMLPLAVVAPSCTDSDGDGFNITAGCGLIDCNDTNPLVNPSAVEVCWNGIDDNCNNQTDEGCQALPIYSKFDGSTTNFTAELDITSVENSVLENTTYGKIEFGPESVDFSGMNLDSYVFIENNLVGIDNAYLPNLAAHNATITLYGISFNNPLILENGIQCSHCVRNSYDGSTLVFTVGHFSNFTAAESAQCMLTDAYWEIPT